jgi:hypothetical protein
MTATAVVAQQQLPDAVAPGAWVRVHVRHLPTPVIGVVRASRNSVLAAESPALFIDADPVRLIRDTEGRPAMDIVAVDVLDCEARMTDEERLDLVAALMRGFADLLASRPWVADDAAAAEALEVEIAGAKAELESLFGGAW